MNSPEHKLSQALVTSCVFVLKIYFTQIQLTSRCAGDSLTYHSGLPFSTMDRDLDTHFQGKSCSGIHGGGGWWYRSCMISNLNGMYVTGGVEDIRGVVWFTWKRNYESLQTITMRLRAKRSWILLLMQKIMLFVLYILLLNAVFFSVCFWSLFFCVLLLRFGIFMLCY